MARRIMRAFTLDAAMSDYIDALTVEDANSPRLMALLPDAPLTFRGPAPVCPPPPLEIVADDLTAKDYEEFFAILHITASQYGKRTIEPTRSVKTLHNALNGLLARDENKAKEVGPQIYERQVRNRRELRKYARLQKRIEERRAARLHRATHTVSASRVADALFTLGKQALEERLAARDVTRSSQSNVAKGKDKLPNAGRRKAVAA